MIMPMANGAIQIKKASSVAAQPQDTGGVLSGNSLIPTALGLITSVQTMKSQQQALTKECEPSDSDVNFVKKMVQEWARAGGAMPVLAGRAPCEQGTNYKYSVRWLAQGTQPCYDAFTSDSDKKQIYANYPYPGKGYSLKDAAGTDTESNRIYVSDLYEIFAAIGFEDADLLPDEASRIVALREKSLRCAPSVISQKQAALWQGMLGQAIGGLGGSSAGTNMGQIGQILSSSGGSALGSITNTLPIITSTLMGQ